MGKRLKNKIIIITGGNGLIGKAIVDEIILEGGFCVNFDINQNTTNNLSNVCCDITNEDSIIHAISLVIKKYNRIDGLVNNAYPRTNDWGNKFEDIELASWRKNVDWQMNSYFFVSQQVTIQMIKQQRGSIINIASIYGVVGPDFTVYEGTDITMPAAYSAIKGGIVNLTKYMAAYFGPKQIRVNAVSPGGVFNGQSTTFVNNYISKTPLRRMANPKDISPSVIFLLSDESSYITGQNLLIDGGWTAI